MTRPPIDGGDLPEQPRPDGTPKPPTDDETNKGKEWRHRIAQWKKKMGKIRGQRKDKTDGKQMPKQEEKDQTKQEKESKRPST